MMAKHNDEWVLGRQQEWTSIKPGGVGGQEALLTDDFQVSNLLSKHPFSQTDYSYLAGLLSELN